MVNIASGPHGQGWNTDPLDACPAAAWGSVAHDDGGAAEPRRGRVTNGPRFWAIDSVTKYSTGPPTEADQGGLEMYLDATVSVGSLSRTPYVGHAVERTTVFGYRTGRRIYELVSPMARPT